MYSVLFLDVYLAYLVVAARATRDVLLLREFCMRPSDGSKFVRQYPYPIHLNYHVEGE